ncbi:phospholipase D family protein [Frisingicoccus sp.]|uniref:phospholipase D family protein n=1 Tax=Frisingicoccus sp. TaxID=1918627 RepID=UPI00399A1D0E
MAFLKKHRLGCLIIAAVLYLLVGAMAPFAIYPEISEYTKAMVSTEQFFENTASGDRAMILETGQSAWEERIRLMDKAEKRIVLTTFDMREGQSTEDVLSVILHKADEGVSVKILIDGISGFLRMEGRPIFYALSTHPNVEIKIYNPVNILLPWRLQGRMHDKYVMVDEKAYFLGGRNSFDYFIGTYETENNSLDREVLVYNPDSNGSIKQLETYFDSVWHMDVCRLFHDDSSLAEHPKVMKQRKVLEERYSYLRENYPELFGDYDYKEVTCPVDGVRLVTNPTGIYAKEPVVFYTMAELMKGAGERVDLHTPYIVCNDYMYEKLGEVADKVQNPRMVINSVENGDNIVASSDYLWSKPSVVDIGFDLYEYDGGTSTHGKSIVIDDDIAIVGSYNFDLRSSYMDTEMMLAVKSPGLAAKLQSNMDALERDCRHVVHAEKDEVPEHLNVADLPVGRYFIMRLIGLVLKPFRFVI